MPASVRATPSGKPPVVRKPSGTITRHGRGLPRAYADAVALVGGEDSLLHHGIVPWQVATMKNQLTAAFRAGDTDRILYLAADLGHYVADACVPLHTTRNYNGQLSGQRAAAGTKATKCALVAMTRAPSRNSAASRSQCKQRPLRPWCAVALRTTCCTRGGTNG